MKNLKTFAVTADIKIDATISINAVNLKDAVEKAEGLHVTDFVDIREDYNDGSVNIVGLYETDED